MNADRPDAAAVLARFPIRALIDMLPKLSQARCAYYHIRGPGAHVFDERPELQPAWEARVEAALAAVDAVRPEARDALSRAVAAYPDQFDADTARTVLEFVDIVHTGGRDPELAALKESVILKRVRGFVEEIEAKCVPEVHRLARQRDLQAEISASARPRSRGSIALPDDDPEAQGAFLRALVECADATDSAVKLATFGLGVQQFGHGVLFEYGWLDPAPTEILPGRFVIGDGRPFGYKVVPEGQTPYVGVALDRPRPGPGGVMILTDLPPTEPHTVGVGRFGDVAEVGQRRTKIGIDKVDRAYDLAAVLERLLDRFHADPRRPDTGFLAGTKAETGVVWAILPGPTRPGEAEPMRLVHCVAPPHQAVEIIAVTGCVYSSHFAAQPSPFPYDPTEPQGWRGRLTLVGQIFCIAAVLRDRLANLIASAVADLRLDAMEALAGRTKQPIDWTDDERRDLERARGELARWRPALRGLTPVREADRPRAHEERISSEPLPGDIHVGILRFLANCGVKCYRTAIVAGLSHYGKNAIHDAIAELHDWKFVHAPAGKRSGVSLLTAGREWHVQFEKRRREQTGNKPGTI